MQDEIGESVKRSVDMSEDQSTANGLHNPPSVFVSAFRKMACNIEVSLANT